MFAYICLGSNDLERSATFYDATLGVLGYPRCDTSAESESSWNGWIGWGLYEKEGAVQDALWVCKPFNGAPATVGNGSMVALWAKNWAAVEAFHAAALAQWWNFGRRAGSAPAVQPGFLRGLRARSGRQQARGGVPRLHFRPGTMTTRIGLARRMRFVSIVCSSRAHHALHWRLAFAIWQQGSP